MPNDPDSPLDRGRAVPSHYEERLQRDLNWIQDLVGLIGQSITRAIDD